VSRRDAIDQAMHSALHGLVHKTSRAAAVEHLKTYFATLPAADLARMTKHPGDAVKLATSYIRDHGENLRLAMKPLPKEERRSLSDDLDRAHSAGLIDGWGPKP
jgi:hypothetical protein